VVRESGITVSDRFRRGPWRSCRVEVEESCRLTRSKLLCISPTTVLLPFDAMAAGPEEEEERRPPP